MARSPTKKSQRVDVNTFVKGLITEASPLNFPANASVDEQNFELNRDGTRDRRRGMDLESGFTYVNTGVPTTSFSDNSYNTFVWTSVGGDANVEFVVVQIGRRLYFFDGLSDAISGEGAITFIDVLEFPDNVQYSFTSVEGQMVVASGAEVIIAVSYESPNIFEYTVQRLKVRDTWGVQIPPGSPDEEYERFDNYRGFPGALTSQQYYNLQNQSWGTPKTVVSGSGSRVAADPLEFFVSLIGRYPSNSEVVWTGMNFLPGSVSVQPAEVLSHQLWQDTIGTGLKSAKGYFIIDLLRRGDSRLEASNRNRAYYPELGNGLVSTVPDFTPGGAQVVTSFAGRVFYAGFGGEIIGPDTHSPVLDNSVAFSRLVKSLDDITKCYQEGDPTSRESNELVDTDGGLIKISGAKKIVGMRTLGSSLIIFATNGVWELSGGSDYGFSATNYKLSQLSTAGAFADRSVVEEQGRIFFWAKDGIYAVAKDQLNSIGCTNITQTTIQTLYEALPTTTKSTAVGEYDPYSKKVRWIYKVGTAFTNTSVTKELVLDTVLGAFYQNVLTTLNNKVETVSLLVSNPFAVGTDDLDVLAGADAVLVGTDPVVVAQSVRRSGLQSLKYLVLVDNFGILNISFSSYNNTNFIDWQQVDGVGEDAKAYLLTGASTAGDSAVDKQIPYIIFHFRRTENGFDVDGNLLNQSGCKMRGQWDFSNTINSNKWSSLVSVYRYQLPHLILNDTYDTGFDVITTKNKLRGSGKCFSLYLETEPGKDCRILGWNISVNGDAIA